MTEREKVIVGLKKLHENGGCVMVYECDCKKCPYERMNGCWAQIIDDAIVLLKAQEPVKPTWRRGIPFCGKCGRQFGRGFKYCPDCGQAVKWDD